MRGFRPAIIVSNDLANSTGTICTVVPLTSNVTKVEQPTHVVISNANNQLKCKSTTLCEQLITVNKDQVRFCLGRVELKKNRPSIACIYGNMYIKNLKFKYIV